MHHMNEQYLDADALVYCQLSAITSDTILN